LTTAPSRSPARRPSLVLVLAAVAGAAALGGCASEPAVDATGAWSEGAPRDRAYQRVLVVGVSPDRNQRCPFERALASRLQGGGTTALVSCEFIDAKTPLTVDAVKAAVAAQGADAVVATNLVSRDWHVEEGGSRDTRGGGMYKASGTGYATGYYGAYGVPVTYGEFHTASSLDTLKSDARVATRFFAAADAGLLYSMETVARNVENRESGLYLLSDAIARQLRREGLVR
jgi:hypothetical protein